MPLSQATPADAPAIAKCLISALDQVLMEFTGSSDRTLWLNFLEYFIELPDNQYSYENCRVYKEDGKIVGAVCLYDGGMLHRLRLPVLQHIRDTYGRDLELEDETGPGEVYIDSLGVLPNHQNRGIGSAILQQLRQDYVVKQGKTLGLLVYPENSSAKNLYLKAGFKPGEKKKLLGTQLEHLTCTPDETLGKMEGS